MKITKSIILGALCAVSCIACDNTCKHEFARYEIPATHLTEGLIKYTCTKCGFIYSEIVSKIEEHTYVYSIVDENEHTKTCECGDSHSEAHSYTLNGSHNGIHISGEVSDYLCICGYIQYRQGENIVDDYHHFDSIEPVDQDSHKLSCTCGEYKIEKHKFTIQDQSHIDDGYILHICSVCGYEKREDTNTSGGSTIITPDL